MGRQLQLATTWPDEVELLRFIQSLVPIRVFQDSARSVDELWIEDWESREVPGLGFKVWPQIFAWSPQYGQTGGPQCPPESAGFDYVANASTAPIFEFDRSFLDRGSRGRIYWARDFCAPDGLDYDADAFSRLVDRVWRWIRKVGRRLPDDDRLSPYWLPDAWAQYGQMQSSK